MSTMIPVPALAAETVVVERYYVAVDEVVAVGQLLAMVRGDRFVWDIPASTAGTLRKIIAEPGTTVATGSPLVEVEQQTSSEGAPTEAEKQEREEPQVAARVRITPLALRIASVHGIDLDAMVGTGYGGCVTRADVLAWLQDHDTHQAPVSHQRASAQNRSFTATTTKATSLAHASTSVPTALTAIEIDLFAAQQALQRAQARAERRGVQLPFTAVVAAAAVSALSKHRLLNSTWSEDGVILRGRVHLLVEQHTLSGIHTTLNLDASNLNAIGLARRLAQPTGNDRMDVVMPTFAVRERPTAWWGQALPHDYAACLVVGAVRHRPHVIQSADGDLIAVRPTVILALSYDARILTQYDADAYLQDVKTRVEHIRSL